jgi:beta-phosphoglucomutase family hydrolase
MKMPDRAILWDLDGVIADTAHYHCLSWQEAFKKRGVNFTEEDFKHHFGQRNDTIILGVLGSDVSLKDIADIAQDKEVIFRNNILKDLRPFPGVIRLLHSTRDNNIKTAIGSSAPLENVQLILSHLKIEDCFQTIVSGEDVTEGKPNPQVFLLGAKKLKVEPSHCIVIEDAVAGVEAAKRGGMLCIAVTNTHPASNLSKADLIVDSLGKVNLAVLNKLFNKNE